MARGNFQLLRREGVESSKHLFFNCSVVRAIFWRVCIWWDMSYMALDSFDEWISWITNLRFPSKHKSILEGVCYGLWWFIWAFRNKKIFGVVPSSKENIFDDLVILSFFFVSFSIDEKGTVNVIIYTGKRLFSRVKTSVRSLNLKIAYPGRSSDRGGSLANRTEARNGF
nr:RNA-directed DNA polymerase, eukaryota [Tanacetum cinerariifolium]